MPPEAAVTNLKSYLVLKIIEKRNFYDVHLQFQFKYWGLITLDHEWGMGVQRGPKSDHTILEQPLNFEVKSLLDGYK